MTALGGGVLRVERAQALLAEALAEARAAHLARVTVLEAAVESGQFTLCVALAQLHDAARRDVIQRARIAALTDEVRLSRRLRARGEAA